jgi:hypothetical protein
MAGVKAPKKGYGGISSPVFSHLIGGYLPSETILGELLWFSPAVVASPRCDRAHTSIPFFSYFMENGPWRMVITF